MKRGNKANTRTKLVTLSLALAMVICGAIGGTLAWLTDQTPEVENVFTPSNIGITLQETGDDETAAPGQRRSFKMIPGWTITKDPQVTVEANSEDAWVFIEVAETGKATVGGESYGFDRYIAYNIDTSIWTPLEGKQSVQVDTGNKTTVYYTKYSAQAGDKTYGVLAGGEIEDAAIKYSWKENEVLTKPTVTKEMMDALEEQGAVLPTLTFQAYAVQMYKNNNDAFSAAEAWAKVAPSNS